MSEEWGSPVPLPLGQATPTRAPKIALMPPPTLLGALGMVWRCLQGRVPETPPQGRGTQELRTCEVLLNVLF